MNINIQYLYIEVSTKCNLKCPHCPRAHESPKYQNKTLSFQEYVSILNNIKGKFKSISLHGIGEPTCCADLQKFIEYTRQTNNFEDITFCSNLSLVPSEFYESCFEKGLTTLMVSFDSMNSETLSACRKNSNQKLICDTLENLAKQFAKNIIVITTVDDYNIHELEKINNYLQGMGIQQWKLQNKIYFDKGTKKENDPESLAIIENIKQRSAMKVIPLHFYPVPCGMPPAAAMVTITGDIIPCCSVYREADYFLGNIFANTFQEIYDSPRAKQFFTDFQNATQKTCLKCAAFGRNS